MTDSTTKRCNACLEVLPLANFTRAHNSPDGLRYSCKDCISKRYKTWYEDNKEAQHERDKTRYQFRKEGRMDAHYRRNYGITLKEYQTLFDKQKGVCAICFQSETAIQDGKVLPLAVDHCHQTGKVRGLLCNRCNRTLSLFDDNIDILKSAIEYLQHCR